MKRYGAKAISILVIILLSLYCLPTPVYAVGLGVSPPSLIIEQTLRGNEYNRSITIFSSSTDTTTVYLTTEGEIGSWATFYNTNDDNNPITELSVPANEMTKINVKIKIPEDASNGEYEAYLNIDTAPIGEIPESGMAIILHSEVLLSVSVTGYQILAGEVTRIIAGNTEIGLPMFFQIDFANTGNVVARPEINIAICQEDEVVGELNYSDTEVKIDATEIIELSWDTNDIISGAYTARVTVMLGGTSIFERELPIRVLPRGGLSGEGRLTGITAEGNATLGMVTKILVTFENTGVVETLVNGFAEIYRDGALVKVLNSAQLEVSGGEQATLTFYFTPNEPGTYEVKVHANMGGRETNTVQLPLTVENVAATPAGSDEVNPAGSTDVTPPPEDPAPTADIIEEVITDTNPDTGLTTDVDKGLAIYWYVIIGLAGAAIIATGYMFVWRRKQFVPVFVGSYNKVFKELSHSKLFKKIQFSKIKFTRTKSKRKKRK